MPKHPSSMRALASAALLATALVLPGCGGLALNSDRIEARFGSYEIMVIDQDRRWRVSSLASLHEGRSITRTLALVRYEKPGLRALAREDRRIRAGESIGNTFRDAGWRISKPTIFLDDVTIGAEAKALAQLMDIELPATLTVHAYRFNVRKTPDRYTYATIVEVHHPEYLTVEELAKIHEFEPGSGSADSRKLLAGLRAMLANMPVKHRH